MRVPSAWGYNWAFLLLGIKTQGPDLPGWGSLKCPVGLEPENDCNGEGQQQL
jgi:hypothetical protein